MHPRPVVTAASPWEAALGGAIEHLHPRIRAYVQGIPEGRVGRGAGVFEVVGTGRRWLWPVFAVLRRQGVLPPGRHRDVSFTVKNRADAQGVLRAERTFLLDRPVTMHDAVRFEGGRLTDDLGTAARYRATLRAGVADGALRLRSTSVSVRVGRWHVPLPRPLAPVVHLREAWDDAAGTQRVHLRLEHPLVGALYEYRGTFAYAIEEEA